MVGNVPFYLKFWWQREYGAIFPLCVSVVHDNMHSCYTRAYDRLYIVFFHYTSNHTFVLDNNHAVSSPGYVARRDEDGN